MTDSKTLVDRLRAEKDYRVVGFTPVSTTKPLCAEAADRIEALSAENDRLREALVWYEKQANDCRKITKEGDDARYALDKDGGERARAALGDADYGDMTKEDYEAIYGWGGQG